MDDYIQQVLPAPGWRVFACAVFDDETASTWEVPVIGWAVMRQPNVPPIQLFVFDEYAMSTEELEFSDNTTCVVLGPGEELTDAKKAALEARAREKAKTWRHTTRRKGTRPDEKQYAL